MGEDAAQLRIAVNPRQHVSVFRKRGRRGKRVNARVMY
jgi:hypothetical protein